MTLIDVVGSRWTGMVDPPHPPSLPGLVCSPGVEGAHSERGPAANRSGVRWSRRLTRLLQCRPPAGGVPARRAAMRSFVLLMGHGTGVYPPSAPYRESTLSAEGVKQT